MREEHIKALLDIYDKEHEFKKNERYSKGGNGIVFTKPDDKWHWLVVEQMRADVIQVSRTDDTGRIIQKDNYLVEGNSLRLIDNDMIEKETFKEKLNRYKELAEKNNRKINNNKSKDRAVRL